jgi:hypothetical protein
VIFSRRTSLGLVVGLGAPAAFSAKTGSTTSPGIIVEDA